MITIEHLSKRYGAKPVLRNINLTFNRGEIHEIVGNNGAGKSTFFRCIASMETFEGTITSEYENIKDHIGFLTTDPYFFLKLPEKNISGYFVMAGR